MRIYCRNCGRHGEDLGSCPRYGEARAEFLRRNFRGERQYEQELEQQGTESLVVEQQRAKEMRRRLFLAEQERRVRMEAGMQAQQVPPQNRVAAVPPGYAQLRMGARTVPAPVLFTAAELKEELHAIPAKGRDVVLRAMHKSLNRQQVGGAGMRGRIVAIVAAYDA